MTISMSAEPTVEIDQPSKVPLSGRWVKLERLRRWHIEALYEIASAEDVADGWPLEGRSIPEAEFEPYLWSLSQLQFAIVRRDSGDTIGLAQGVNPDFRSRTVDVGIVIAPAMWRAGWPLEGLVLFVNYLFSGLRFRKLYFSMTGSVQERLGAGLTPELALECSFTRHIRSGDGYEDLSIFSLRRGQWDSEAIMQATGN